MSFEPEQPAEAFSDKLPRGWIAGFDVRHRWFLRRLAWLDASLRITTRRSLPPL